MHLAACWETLKPKGLLVTFEVLPVIYTLGPYDTDTVGIT